LNSSSPTWRSVAPMNFPRRQLNATILPDGKVLVTGGTQAPGFDNLAGAVFAAEVWDPVTERWTVLASMTVPRLYHSTAILLPDGRVLAAGGNSMETVEFFSPPYLFNGQRPTILDAPSEVYHGQTFTILTPQLGSISSVNMIRLSSVTHAFNMDQRFIKLAFLGLPLILSATVPSSANICPPGFYMLFLVDSFGVPSQARIIRVKSRT
jgi:hypothetical protein